MLPSRNARETAICDFLLKTIREKGFAPSIPEIGKQFKIASTNGVSDHLKALEKKGYIRRVGKRAIEVVNALGKTVLTATRDVPILGKVPAGKPLISEEKKERVFSIPDQMGSGKIFFFQVKRDRMIGGGIFGGDKKIVEQQGTTGKGE